ncbi:glycosyltransferase [Tumebacillus permanentifrigoris]|uniref:Glycosyltransferase involved in cell wall biosynthesis n=1 Tax=Tumebacillus permanentifrigoris TaxID=378543 RepID=A0A316DAP1_9BACL|nr:glycosyltransferase [Tumebacillus permanentifrigoris]PWK13760.1 glycosyltransferase involved in cell wall biosynthesis [Tumebacillus permanentifrigoris]
MNILIVLPPNMPSGGNWTYSGRLQRGLAPHGIHIKRLALDQVQPQDYEAADIIHSYNAYSTGRQLAPIAKQYQKPFVLTMTGTDVNEHLIHPDTRPSMVEAVEYASSIICLTQAAADSLADVYPAASGKAMTINLGIDLPQGVGKTRADFGLQDDDFIFLLVAGIRPVKRPLDALEPLARVHQQHPQVRFVLAGQKLDDTTYREVLEQFATHTDFARYLGAVPYEEIADLYRAADVVMNTSTSEGLSHALLEAMSLGRAILASNVPGNRDLIQDGENGFLYADGDELVEKATRLYTDEQTLVKVSEGALQTIHEHFSLERELEAFRTMYNNVYSKNSCTTR